MPDADSSSSTHQASSANDTLHNSDEDIGPLDRPTLNIVAVEDTHLITNMGLWALTPTTRSSTFTGGGVLEGEVPELKRTQTNGRHWWKFHLREWDDDEEQDWWFASIAIPLLAATIGPLANVLSIAALVTSWRMCVVDGVSKGGAANCSYDGSSDSLVSELDGISFTDPKWCYDLNIVSLVTGFVGNFFLLCNFTNRIRYIIALPVTIVCWYVSAALLVGITVSMELYVPPSRPAQTYTQGYWYAVIAACMYTICSMLLMVNMLGYFLGHYQQHFRLTESQRTLILQTMMFFVWLAGGAALFAKVETEYGSGIFDWSFVNSLYFCDVTILTVGFGDLYVTSNVGRGLLFPYSVGGIIMLGLMVSSISKFAFELGSENIIQRHREKTRVRTVGRTVTSSMELKHRQTLPDDRPVISPPFDPVDTNKGRTIGWADAGTVEEKQSSFPPPKRVGTLQRVGSYVQNPRTGTRKPKLILLREERDRFNAMRHIQKSTANFKNWYALFLSITAFGILWCCGAIVFWQTEKHTENEMTYFKALYFCYVSLITIGYGDLSPKSNAGRPFFVFWSLVAVPTMTILIGDLGETVINKFKSGTSGLADFTVLPQKGAWRSFFGRYPGLLTWLQQKRDDRAAKKRLEDGFQIGPAPENPPTIDDLAREDELSQQDLAKRLTRVIQRTAMDVKEARNKRYTYEEWVEFTQLIRFTAVNKSDTEVGDEQGQEGEEEEDTEGMIEWDWIGEDSPMMSNKSETEFVLDRLCESMQRYVRMVSEPATTKTLAAAPPQKEGNYDERAKSG